MKHAQNIFVQGPSRSCLDQDEARKLLLSYYPNRHQSIRKGFDAANWMSLGKYTYLTDEQIVEAVDGVGGAYRGLRWGDQTRFAVLDIDKDSQYHNVHSLKKISNDLSEIGISQIQKYQSSTSTGWHLYISLDRFCSSEEIESLLKPYLKSEGYKIVSGQLEVFPSGNGLRLPLQEGFAWLADDGSIAVKREDLSTEHAIKKFVLDIEYGANDWEHTKSRIKEILEARRIERQKEAEIERELRLSTEGMDGLFQGRIIQENYDRGKKFFKEGLKSNGERHDAVICVEHYLWHGDDSLGIRALPGRLNDYDRYEAILSWLKKKHNECCNHINRGDWKTVEAQIQRAVDWRSLDVPERTPYIVTSDRALDRIIGLTKSTGRTWTTEDWRKANDKRKKEARVKIEKAVEQITAAGEKLSIRAVARISGCHRSTVKKHFDLLSSGLSDLEPGGVGGFGLAEVPRSEILVDLPVSENEKDFDIREEIVVLDLSDLEEDPELGVSRDSSLIEEDLESRKYVSDIAAGLSLAVVETDGPVSLASVKKKKSLESRRIVVSENGQLAIDFGVGLVRRRRGRGPPR